MKKRLIYCAVTGILTAVLFTGCGDGSETGEGLLDALEPIALTATPDPESAQATGEPDKTSEPGTGESGSQSSGLEDLGPEVAATVLESLNNLKQNMELPEYLGEAIHLVSSEEWFASVAVELRDGSRSYLIGGAGGPSLSVQVGYDTEDKPYVNASYQTEGQILLLTYAKEAARVLQTGVSGGAYNGAFEEWQINGGTGYMLKETGTYVNGILVGQCTKAEYTGGPGDVFDLWTNRENFEYKITELNYNEQGQVEPVPSATPAVTQKPAVTDRPVRTTAPSAAPTVKPQRPTQAPPQPTQEPPQSTPEPPQPTLTPPEPTQAPPEPTQAPPEPTQAPPEPTQAPPEPPQPPQPTPEPPSEGGDTDIEWSPDMM